MLALFPFFALLLTLLGWQVSAPEPPLVLRPVKPDFVPALFTVAAVHDEQPGLPPAAWLLPVAAGDGITARPVKLRGGTEAALREFLAATLPPYAARYPITVRVLALAVHETAVPGAPLAAGAITVRLAFDWRNSAGRTITLTEYRGGARYRRSRPDRAVVETALRQTLLSGFRYFNQWLTTAAVHDVRLATAVRPTFRYEIRQNEPDTLFYNPDRPLAWTDFTGSPHSRGQYAAAVFPSFAYQGRPRVVNGVVQLDITLAVFVVRSSSWVAEGQRTADNLNHEQRHFDLVRLVVERFRRKATPDSLTVADYQSILGWQYLKSFTEMNHLQDQYDQETRGGRDAAAQQQWNQRIDAELRAYNVIR